MTSRLQQSHFNIDVLVSQWQRNPEKSKKYLCFRWFIFIIFSLIIICSLADVGRNNSEKCEGNFVIKWPIYLTHWTMTFCFLQSLMSAILTTFAFCGQEKKNFNFLLKIYSAIYANAVVFGFTTTIWYWTLIHKPEIHPIDIQNVLAHIMIGFTMLADLAITGHKLTINNDIIASVGVAIGYVIFSYFYFIFGGTNCEGEDQIYPVLNWNKASKTWVFCAGKALFVATVHLLAYLLCRFRIFVYEKYFKMNFEIKEDNTFLDNGDIMKIDIS